MEGNKTYKPKFRKWKTIGVGVTREEHTKIRQLANEHYHGNISAYIREKVGLEQKPMGRPPLPEPEVFSTGAGQ